MDDLGAKATTIETIVFILRTKTCASFGLIYITLLYTKNVGESTIKFVMLFTTDIVFLFASLSGQFYLLKFITD